MSKQNDNVQNGIYATLVLHIIMLWLLHTGYAGIIKLHNTSLATSTSLDVASLYAVFTAFLIMTVIFGCFREYLGATIFTVILPILIGWTIMLTNLYIGSQNFTKQLGTEFHHVVLMGYILVFVSILISVAMKAKGAANGKTNN